MVTLEAKTTEQLAAWMPVQKAEYIAERVKAGEHVDLATKTSDAQFAELFPNGSPAEGQYVMNVIADQEIVGTLWMGRPFSGAVGTWFIFDIEIEETARGRGLGRSAMEAAEEWTRELGGTRVALNVFGPNRTARSLYESLGHQIQAIAMYKDL